MNKKLLYMVPFLLLGSNSAFAFQGGAGTICSEQNDGFSNTCRDVASKFEMTMKGFRLRKANSDEFITLTTNTATYDFAAANAGATVASYLTNGTIPPGVYDAVSPILSTSITVAGSTELATGGDTCRLDSGAGDITDGGAAENVVFSMDGDAETADGTDAVEGLSLIHI